MGVRGSPTYSCFWSQGGTPTGTSGTSGFGKDDCLRGISLRQKAKCLDLKDHDLNGSCTEEGQGPQGRRGAERRPREPRELAPPQGAL